MDGEVLAGIAGTNGYWLRDDENHEMAQKEWTLYMLLVELRCAGERINIFRVARAGPAN
jgi:hypothetical protein